MATLVEGIRSGDCLMRGEICSRIRETLLPCGTVPDRNDGGTREGLTLALYTFRSVMSHRGMILGQWRQFQEGFHRILPILYQIVDLRKLALQFVL